MGKSIATNFAVNLAAGSIGGKVSKPRFLEHIANPPLRRAAAEGIGYAADVAITGTIQEVRVWAELR